MKWASYLDMRQRVTALISQILISNLLANLEKFVMPRKVATALIPLDRIERQIYIVRGQRVMLDADLAAIYRVTTAALNQAVRRNIQRFPSEFAFRLTPQEF